LDLELDAGLSMLGIAQTQFDTRVIATLHLPEENAVIYRYPVTIWAFWQTAPCRTMQLAASARCCVAHGLASSEASETSGRSTYMRAFHDIDSI
jgi:hypothetical protein